MDNHKAQRTGKTKRALAAAMMALLEREPFSKITVNDLCEAAMVSRSTFYLHFEDKYRLLAFCLDDIRDRLFERCPEGDSRARLRGILENIQQNRRLLRNLLLAELDTELLEMVQASFEADFSRLQRKSLLRGTEPIGPSELVSTFYAAGISSVILRWIANELPYTADEIAGTLTTLMREILPPSADD